MLPRERERGRERENLEANGVRESSLQPRPKSVQTGGGAPSALFQHAKGDMFRVPESPEVFLKHSLITFMVCKTLKRNPPFLVLWGIMLIIPPAAPRGGKQARTTHHLRLILLSRKANVGDRRHPGEGRRELKKKELRGKGVRRRKHLFRQQSGFWRVL